MATVVVDVPPLANGANSANGMSKLAEVQEKYAEERIKRMRSDGLSQFIDIHEHEKFKKFQADPWITSTSANDTKPALADGDKCEFLIMGAGYGGLSYAAEFIKAGFSSGDIKIVDNAGGFGGTWYWNRYPGLYCDVESYIYMPLLEETGYMPTKKYVTGQELREHAERIAHHFDLTDKALFSTQVKQLRWNQTNSTWQVKMQRKVPDKPTQDLTVQARFVILATGFIVFPHVPQIPGIDKFKGACFHTARWDYDVSGGTADNPELVKFRDKRVGVIGTGATSIQVVPSIAKWSKELHVFQRTPSAVDVRGNRDTEAEWWNAEIRDKKGWQSIRRMNFNKFISNLSPKPATDMVNDGWTSMPSYSALIGSGKVVEPSEVPAYSATLHSLDFVRAERIRARVDEVVHDAKTAASLKAWYPGWCKRPCFHDEYLQSYNRPNVTLVDTAGKGVDEITENGLIVAGKEYPIDVLILSTGYRSPFLFSPPGRVDIEVLGRNDRSLDKKWMTAVTTLHGMMSHDFPNLFWPGFSQSGGSPNFMFCIDLSAAHIARLLSEIAKRNQQRNAEADTFKYNFTVEATSEAEEDWSNQVAAQAGVFAATAGCTPSYINGEGEMDKPVEAEVLKKRARAALWGKGVEDFVHVLEQWRNQGDFKGIEIKHV